MTQTHDTPTHSLNLDTRQRAMLKAMGVTVWWPEATASEVAAPTSSHATAVAARSAPATPTTEPEHSIANKSINTSDTSQKHTQFHSPQPPAPAPNMAPTTTADVRTLDWEALAPAVARCTACGLCQERTHAVPGVGPRRCAWMVVLDTPNEQEDRQGQTPAEPEGPLLQAMLAAMGLDSSRDVFITHALKCRGALGRNPTPDELALCRPYLLRQVELVQPSMVLALGRLAAQALLGSQHPEMGQWPLGKLRGHVHTAHGVPVVVSYPPHNLLRSPANKAKAWEDLCLAMNHVGHSALTPSQR